MEQSSHNPYLTSPRFGRRRTPDLPHQSQIHPALDISTNDPFGPGGSASSFITSSNRRMVPRDELELSRPFIARAEKDGDDTASSARRRPMPERSQTGTPTRLTRLFGSAATSTSPGPSRTLSLQKSSPVNAPAARVVRSDGDPLPSHLYQRGLLEGKYSDINITAFGTTYQLHRIVLDRAPFFASALSPPWLEASAKDVTLHPEDIDTNITKAAFELALRRLYGHPDPGAEADEAFSLFATACWLEMNELVSVSVEHLLRRMQLSTLPSMINMVTVNYYGKAGERVLHAAKAMLSRDGAEMPLRYWDDVSSEVIRDVVGGDSFYVLTECQRWVLAVGLLNRRLKLVAREMGIVDSNTTIMKAPFSMRPASPEEAPSSGKTVTRPSVADPDLWAALYSHVEILPLLDLLENGIYYVHLDFEKLQHVKSARDVFGVLLLSERVTNDALWTGLELRQKVLNAKELDEELGFSQSGQVQQSRSPISTTPSTVTTPMAMPIPMRPLLEVSADEPRLSQSLTPIKPSTKHLRDGVNQYWIPSVDCNIVTGGIEPVVTLSTSVSDRAAAKEKSRLALINEEPRPTDYTVYPPFRFSAEFPNPRQFKPGKRVYSQTVFYAGSSWNVYLQRFKNTGSRSSQLGFYLHRAKEAPVDEDPWSSSGHSVDDRIGDLERQLHRLQNKHHRRREYASPSGTSLADTAASRIQDPRLPSIVTDSTGLASFMTSTRRSMPSANQEGLRAAVYQSQNPSDKDNDADDSASNDDSMFESILPDTVPQGKPALGAYFDTRPEIKAYFKVFSPSRDGRMMSVYESAPAQFSFGQSWGWRSSSFFTDENVWLVEELDVTEETWLAGAQDSGRAGEVDASGFTGEDREDDDSTIVPGSKRAAGNSLAGGKLRFMVALGVV